jgi:hypothetical protein
MKIILRVALSILLLIPAAAQAQKKKVKIIQSAELPAVQEFPNAFPQFIGVSLIAPPSNGKTDPAGEAAPAIAQLGARMVRLEVKPGMSWAPFLEQPFTHLILIFRPLDDWSQPLSAEKRREVYNAYYALAKDLLTRRETPGRFIFIGNQKTDEFFSKNNPEGEVTAAMLAALKEWTDLREEAIAAARAEVPQSRCRIFTYIEVNHVWAAYKADEARVANAGLPKIKTDFVAYAAQEIQDKPAQEINATLDYLNQQLVPRPDLPVKRVFISECGVGWAACGGNAAAHEKRNRAVLAKFISWQPPVIFYDESYYAEAKRQSGLRFRLVELKGEAQSLYQTLNGMYGQQTAYALKLKQHEGHLPSAAQIAQITDNYLNATPAAQ